MGTRSITVLMDTEKREIAVLYRQYDGYPDGHGQELADFLKGFVVTNGIDNRPEKSANGMDCLAAQIVSHFKGVNVPGNFYLYPAGTRDCGEEYIYTVYKNDTGLRLKCQNGCITMFGLPGTKQDNMGTLFDDSPEKFNGEKIGSLETEPPPSA